MFNLLYSHSLLQTPIDSPVLKFLVILSIILFAPLLFNRIRIPHILGLIIAGAIIGPYGLNLVLRDDGIVLSGTAGLLYIMFLAGLEIDMNEFVKSRAKSLVFGLFTFVIPMAVGIATGLYLLDFSLKTSILLASMFASHTLLAYPIISKLGVKRNRAVTVTIGGTVIAETLALLVLAIVVETTKGAVDATFWITFAASLSIFAAVIFVGFPIVTRLFLKNFSDGLTQYIFILFMLFLGASLAEVVEIEGIIGALFTGLALNRLIPHSSALMNRIEFIGNAIFIPFFLIGVGMLIDYRVFISDWNTLYVAFIMTTMATIAKFVASWLAQKSFGYTSEERTLIFGLSNARAAATLAVVLVGYNIILDYTPGGDPVRLFNDSVLNGTIVMIFITCTIASFSAQRGASKISMNEQIDLDDTNDDEMERILLPINNIESTTELMSFTNLIAPKQGNSTVTVAAVIGESKDEVAQVTKAKKIFERAIQSAASMDRPIETNMRYDVSYTSGILNMIKESDISDLVLAVDSEKFKKGKLINKIFDDSMKSSSVTTFMYRSYQPVETIKRHIVIIPPHAENELGFRAWIVKIWNLLRATGSSAVVYANAATIRILERMNRKVSLPIKLNEYVRYQDILIIGKDMRPDDGLIFIMSKKFNPSYDEQMDHIPHYIDSYFSNMNFVLIYPYQKGANHHSDIDSLTNRATITAVSKIEDVIDNVIGAVTKRGENPHE
ncbi:MAG: cation:proton antiporter [Rikenellaceae bacterium]